MTSDELARREKINKEIKRLSAVFTKIEPRTKKAVLSLIKQAAFMTVTLEELQDDMNEKGVVSEYQNGENQWGTKKSPEVEIYNTMVKNHASIIKQLTDLLPKVEPVAKDDEYDKFVEGRDK